MTHANLATQQGYYYLYALYFDYVINNRFHAELEHEARIRQALRSVAEVIRYTQPYRKTWALRLFTERESLARFRPELVSEAWRQLRELIDRIGPPRGWPPGAHLRLLPAPPPHPRPEPPPEFALPPAPSAPAFPRSPINYEFDV